MAGLSQTRLCAQPTQASVVKADHLRVDMDAPGRFLYYEVDCHRDGWITQLDDRVEELMEKNMVASAVNNCEVATGRPEPRGHPDSHTGWPPHGLS